MSKKQKSQQLLVASQNTNREDGKNARSKASNAEAASASHDLLEQAEVCCREARVAARMKRLRAACGLFQTAQSLLKRAIETGGAARQEAAERLAQIGNEAAVYAELCRDKTLRPSPKPVPIRVQVQPRKP